MKKIHQFILMTCSLLLLLQSCAERSKMNQDNVSSGNAEGMGFKPFQIKDSAQVLVYENGVRLYKILDGPGDFTKAGMDIRMNYHGMLDNHKVFDSSFLRDEPLKFRLGDSTLIDGLEYGIGRLRLGSKAIIVIPPALAYKNREDVQDIPPNSTLTFHVELLGTF